MKYKALLLDFDGVISPGRLFSEIYSEEFGVGIEQMLPFFNEMKDTLNIGNGDLRESLSEVLPDWNWNRSVDELIDYWMNADSDVDTRFISLAEGFRDQGGMVYLATDQEKYRTEFIWGKRGLKEWLDGKFVSNELGYHKGDPQFFRTILDKLGIQPEEAFFTDDSKSKIESANSVGLDTHLYEDFEGLREILEKSYLA